MKSRRTEQSEENCGSSSCGLEERKQAGCRVPKKCLMLLVLLVDCYPSTFVSLLCMYIMSHSCVIFFSWVTSTNSLYQWYIMKSQINACDILEWTSSLCAMIVYFDLEIANLLWLCLKYSMVYSICQLYYHEMQECISSRAIYSCLKRTYDQLR